MLKTILISICSGAVGGMIFVLAHSQIYSKSMGVVHVDRLLADHLKANSGKKMTEEQRSQVAASFSKALDVVIKGVSREMNVTLLVAPAVVTESPDYTPLIQEEIEKQMDKGRGT